MTQQCSHQTTADIDARWADPRTKAVSVEDLTVCPHCCGPAKVGPPIPVDEYGRFQLGDRTYEAYPGFGARLIENCSRCRE